MLGTSMMSCEMVRYAQSKGIYTIVTDYLVRAHFSAWPA